MRNIYTKLFMFSMVGLVQPATAAIAADAVRANNIVFEEVIVTAQKREQRLIEVPMSIATMTGAELEQRGLDSLQDISFAVPGLTLREDGPGSYQVFLRGIANTDGGGALVSVYQDEYVLTLNGYNVLPTRVMDIARVEVLKGPQGTLYGQGAVAGTVRYITKDPDLDGFSGRAEGEVETVKGGDVGAGITGILNVPVVKDKFALRIAARYEDGGGWQDQPEAGIENGNGTELKNLRVKALWQVTEDFQALGTFIVYRAETELGQGYEQPDRTVFVGVDPAKTLIPKIWDYELYNMKLTYDLGFAEILSSTTYVDMDHQYPFSYFGGPETIYGGILEGYGNRFNPGDQFTQEIRMASTGDGPFNWTIGGYYQDFEVGLISHYGTLYGGFVYDNLEYTSQNTSKSFALFADASYKLSDRLEVGAGIRYFEDDATETVEPAPQKTGTFDSVDPRFYATYALSDDVNIYASVAKGFRSGGFNGYDAGGLPLPDYQPESLWSYEVGLKGSLLDGRMYLDVAGYYTRYNQMQRRGLVFLGAERGFQSLVSNVGKVEVYGIEGTLNYKVTDDFVLDASVAVIDSEVKEINADDTANIVGDPTDYVADYSFTVGAVYNFTLGDDRPAFVRVNYSYRDELPYVDRTSFPAENVPQFSDSIGLLDVRAGVDIANFNIEIYAQNLTNVNKYIDPYHGWNNANRTRPRTIGMKVGVDF